MALWCFLSKLSMTMFIVVGLSLNRVLASWSADPGSRDGRQCQDWCPMMSHMCANNSTCIMNHIDCTASCRCINGWSGKWCKDPVPTDSINHVAIQHSLTESNVPEREEIKFDDRFQSFSSSSGKVASQMTQIASQSLQTTTLRPSSASLSSNVVSKGIDGKMSDTEERETCQKDCHDGDCIKINDIYKCKLRINTTNAQAPRTCSPGFECEHGVCDMEQLSRNFYKCICESNYVGQFCNKKCPFDCGSHGFCEYDVGERVYKCFCSWNYTGLNCSEPVPLAEEAVWQAAEVTFHWYVVGISVAIVVCLVIAVAMAAYLMWKRRLVFILKIVHYFQHCEEDDGKEYDAFVSYKSCPRDESFVLQKLYPKLEEEFNFKLCMHFRDFIPGEAIANNIVRAIESSRRTIMILSPSYVTSEWCRLEYQKAQHEMLKLKHKIIPIVLDDISKETNVDKNLRSILNSVTYLEWPGDDSNCSKKCDRFWQKLQLSLPKKSVNSPSSLTDGSCSASRTSSYTTSSTTSSVSCSVSSASTAGCKVTYPSYANTAPVISSTESTSLSKDAITSLGLEDSATSLPPCDSPAPSIELRKSHRMPNKRKEFKHFVDKLVKNKLFKRQDSSSSQAALVDEETVASRSSCDSISESFATESSDSACSTPITAHTYLSNMFYTETSKEFMSETSEKDSCGCTACETCIRRRSNFCVEDPTNKEQNSEFVNKRFDNSDPDESTNKLVSCIQCKQIRKMSDNNRVKITKIDKNVSRLEQLPGIIGKCPECHQDPLGLSILNKQSKEDKEAVNRKILHLRRKDSLSQKLKQTTPDNRVNERDLVSGSDLCHGGIVNESFSIDICEEI